MALMKIPCFFVEEHVTEKITTDIACLSLKLTTFDQVLTKVLIIGENVGGVAGTDEVGIHSLI